MVVVQIGGLAVCFALNMYLSHKGHKMKSDRQFFVPPASILFTFYPIMIALPEAHYKLINYSIQGKAESFDQDQLFPYAFLISLASITISAVIDKFMLGDKHTEEEESGLTKSDEEWHKHKNSLQFLLTLSIALQMVANYYYICIEPHEKQQIKQLLLFLLFSLIINFAHGFLLSLTGVVSKTNLKLSIFMNAGMLVGFILSLIIQPDMALLILPCISAGLQIYCSIFICFSFIFTNGQKPKEDKSRFLAIVIAFLATILYYPICYFLRI